MNTGPRSPDERPATEPISVILLRLAVLVGLTLIAFRQELSVIVGDASHFSEWSHALALPVIASALVFRRRDDIRRNVAEGTLYGMAIVALGIAVWFVSRALGVFGYARLLGLLICLAGLVAFVAGWAAARLAMPLLGMIWLCLPLGERSMERFSLGMQRVSVGVTGLVLRALPEAKVNVKGTILTYTYRDRQGDIGLAEQRFGFRLLPACLLLGAYRAFSRPRPAWQLAVFVAASLPIVFASNILRMTGWAMTTIYGGCEPTSAAPRNVSLALGLLAAYAGFVLTDGLIALLGRLGGLFLVEDVDAPTRESAWNSKLET